MAITTLIKHNAFINILIALSRFPFPIEFNLAGVHFCFNLMNCMHLLASTADWTVHLLIANLPRPPAETSPMHETALIGMPVAVEMEKLQEIFTSIIRDLLTSFLSSPFFLRKFETTTCNSSACFSYSCASVSVKSETEKRAVERKENVETFYFSPDTARHTLVALVFIAEAL
jgi:hypothetical protein